MGSQQHALVRDEDGTFLEESNGGTILPRAEMFSEGSFFLSPYKDDINIPNQEWWYPTVPSVMRTSKAGDLVNGERTPRHSHSRVSQLSLAGLKCRRSKSL